MKIINSSKKYVLSTNAVQAISLKDKFLGLITAKPGTSMIFNTRFGIHTFFMNYPIDILILNERNQVAKIKKALKPNKAFFWDPAYSIILELPAGAVNKSKTRIGDFIEVI